MTRTWLRASLVPGPAVRPAPLLQLGLVQVPPAAGKRIAGIPLQLAKLRVVTVVVLLDELECPAAGDDVAADEVVGDPVGDRVVAGRPEQLHRVVEEEVGL